MRLELITGSVVVHRVSAHPGPVGESGHGEVSVFWRQMRKLRFDKDAQGSTSHSDCEDPPPFALAYPTIQSPVSRTPGSPWQHNALKDFSQSSLVCRVWLCYWPLSCGSSHFRSERIYLQPSNLHRAGSWTPVYIVHHVCWFPAMACGHR